MNKIRNKMVLLLLVVLVFSAMPAFAANEESTDLRGVWVATVLNIDYPSKGTVDANALKEEAITILDNVEKMGLNAVFLQVRPTADAFYESKYFPWSTYLTGEQGVAPSQGFDPLKFWIEEAHKRGIELHAWINPYRITKNYTGNIQDAWNQLVDTHAAKQRRELVVEHFDGNLYFNPGLPEVRSLVSASILEIVLNYDVDGIHFDDYFYPGTDFEDSETYKKYGQDFASIGDWRRDNVTKLVKMVNETIDQVDPEVEFGISPFGIWANKGSNDLGSETRGNQSYYSHYADTRLWVKEGYLDYINPQIYWNIGFTIADYSILLDWWTDVVEGTDVKLYTGHAAYKAGNSDTTSPWYGDIEIIKQISLNEKNPEVDGSVFFSYRSFINRPSLMNNLTAYYQYQMTLEPKTPIVTKPSTVKPAAISEGLTITNPSKNIETSQSGYYIYGVSDPNTPLYMNNELLTYRSPKGYFGIFVNLNAGVNTFTFTQNGLTDTRTITKKVSDWTPTLVTNPTLVTSSLSPMSFEAWSPGDVYTLKCYAPIGSDVNVTINDETFKMNPATTFDYGGPIYNTSFTYQYTIPENDETAKIVPLGDIIYTMNYKGMIETKTAQGKIYSILKDYPMMALVNKDTIDSYFYPDTGRGSSHILTKGMQDHITAMTGDYVRISNGTWLKKSDINIVMNPDGAVGEVTATRYTKGQTWDTLDFTTSHNALSYATFDGEVLTLNILNSTQLKQVSLPSGSLFGTATGTVENQTAVYKFNVVDMNSFNGYIVEKTETGIRLSLKKKPQLINSSQPLKGMTIVVDAGHGGSDPGALGILGIQVPEKAINLSTALLLQDKLEAMGAEVVMTRTSDVYISLQSRLALSRKIRPDMFISVHVNSIGPDRDINQVNGFSVHYNNPLAKGLSQNVLDEVIGSLNRNSRRINVNNFYVVRGTWAPTILVEMGFMVNPLEFDYLEGAKGQGEMAEAITQGIIEYFK